MIDSNQTSALGVLSDPKSPLAVANCQTGPNSQKPPMMMCNSNQILLTVKHGRHSVLEVDDGGRAALDAVLPVGEVGVGDLDEVELHLA